MGDSTSKQKLEVKLSDFTQLFSVYKQTFQMLLLKRALNIYIDSGTFSYIRKGIR